MDSNRNIRRIFVGGFVLALLVGAGLGRLTAGPKTVHINRSSTPLASSTDNRNAEGAANAAAYALQQLYSAVVQAPQQRNAAIAAVATDSTRAAIEAQWQDAAATTNQSLHLSADGSDASLAFLHFTPITWLVTSYSDNAAEISVWGAEQMAAVNRIPNIVYYSTSVVRLQWTPSGWRYESSINHSGPVPNSTQTPSNPVDFIDATRLARTYNNAHS